MHALKPLGQFKIIKQGINCHQVMCVVILHGISRTLVEVLNKWQCKVLVIKHLGEIKNETKTSLSKACISLGQEQLISKKILQDLSPLEGD